MKKDPIVEEIRQYREQHAAWFNHDLHAICQDLKEQEHRSKRAFVFHSPRCSESENTSNIM